MDVAVEGMPKRAETRDITVTVTSSDWQQGATVDPLYPQLTNPDGLQATPSNIAGVGLEIPVFEFFSTEPTATVGAGTPANPRVDRWTLTTDPTTWGTFPFVVWVEDDRQPTDFTGLTSNADLRAFRIGFITIEP
ncbi:MAG TPA: hypothetical protein VEI97_12405 [bacterium]|nr:hypothetical protein [bacterium]